MYSLIKVHKFYATLLLRCIRVSNGQQLQRPEDETTTSFHSQRHTGFCLQSRVLQATADHSCSDMKASVTMDSKLYKAGIVFFNLINLNEIKTFKLIMTHVEV